VDPQHHARIAGRVLPVLLLKSGIEYLGPNRLSVIIGQGSNLSFIEGQACDGLGQSLAQCLASVGKFDRAMFLGVNPAAKGKGIEGIGGPIENCPEIMLHHRALDWVLDEVCAFLANKLIKQPDGLGVTLALKQKTGSTRPQKWIHSIMPVLLAGYFRFFSSNRVLNTSAPIACP
jgi:hypothetical protein